MSEEANVRKNVLALTKRLGGAQVLWAVPASVLLDVQANTQRLEHDGVLAEAAGQLHYYRKGLVGALHEKIPLADVTSFEETVAKFGDGDQQLILLHRSSGPPWGAICDDPDRHAFLVGKLDEKSG